MVHCRAGEHRPRLVGREGGDCCVCVCLTRGALPCSFVRREHTRFELRPTQPTPNNFGKRSNIDIDTPWSLQTDCKCQRALGSQQHHAARRGPALFAARLAPSTPGRGVELVSVENHSVGVMILIRWKPKKACERKEQLSYVLSLHKHIQ